MDLSPDDLQDRNKLWMIYMTQVQYQDDLHMIGPCSE